jgi:hypothetical protein
MNRRSLPIPSARTVALVFLVMAAFALGRATNGTGTASAGNEIAMQSSGSPESEATATRAAELIELSDLRTQVAGGLNCTPGATGAATATPVPPVAAGAPMPYGDDWTVTVVDISMMPTVRDVKAPGQFAKVSIIAVNNTSDDERFPYDTLLLRDATGRVFRTSQSANGQDIANWYARFPPSVAQGGYVYFDVAIDAKGPFILESTTDPTFRVLIDVEVRG